VHETRLFPKGLGADAYEITGIARRCDLVVLSDQKPPHTRIVRQCAPADTVRHIFVSLRAPQHAITCLLDEVLPGLDAPFTLVSGSEDQTFPTQRDLRFPAFKPELDRRVRKALDHPLLTRWHAENLSGHEHPKLEPMPLGMTFTTQDERVQFAPRPGPGLYERALRAFCAHRVRPGAQWDVRLGVTELARSHWGNACEIAETILPITAFDAALRRNAFVLCVQGGGYDPSPKAWRSLLHGAIPIICDSPVARAYLNLPVVILPAWDPEAVSLERLAAWRDRLAPWFDGDGRRTVLERLNLDYWWDRVCASAPACGPAGSQLAIGPDEAGP
jgi:hypothetical protein